MQLCLAPMLNWFLGSKSHSIGSKPTLSWQREKGHTVQHNFLSLASHSHTHTCVLCWCSFLMRATPLQMSRRPSSAISFGCCHFLSHFISLLILGPVSSSVLLSFWAVIRSYQTPNSASIWSTHQHLERVLVVLTWGRDTHISCILQFNFMCVVFVCLCLCFSASLKLFLPSLSPSSSSG